MALLFAYLFLALAVSFLCSVAEAVILSVPLTFVKTKEIEGRKTAQKLKQFKEDIDKPLSSILSLNTIAHTVGAAGVGAQATAIFGETYFGLVSAVLTILILLLSEILPKSLGTRYCRQLALPVAQALRIMIIITYPVVLISLIVTKLVSGRKIQEKVSREEVAALTEIGREEGVFAENESKIINNLLRLQSIKVSQAMTPRTVAVSAAEDSLMSEFMQRTDVKRHSRFPVYSQTVDDITGYVLKLEIMEKMAQGKDLKLKEVKRPITICYAGTSIPKIFDTLLCSKEQIALVVDEYGGMDGIVTLEDIIETIFGMEIIDEKDSQTDMQQLARDRWKNKAKNMNIEINFDENQN
ncbi:MAG: CNNM domain-containing protein [Prevotellaceae bacterium]|jgi:CBS domain containing-hemolysin-like protein|nr:CNNM domain-containing protein [Prevotellaceae bacterium]